MIYLITCLTLLHRRIHILTFAAQVEIFNFNFTCSHIIPRDFCYSSVALVSMGTWLVLFATLTLIGSVAWDWLLHMYLLHLYQWQWHERLSAGLCFRPVSDGSTKVPQPRLTSEFGWDLVYSRRYGRQQISCLRCLYSDIFEVTVYTCICCTCINDIAQ